jgi:hypothetical protein
MRRSLGKVGIDFFDVDQGVTAYLHQLENQQALDGVMMDCES